MSQRIIIAGASGFLGKRLVGALRNADYQVQTLKRGTDEGLSWDPSEGRLDENHLAGADAVICLSGASIAGKPWTQEYIDELYSSRLESVDTLVAAMERLPAEQRPKSFLCASAVGYYGPSANEETNEDRPAGEGILADLCVQWEAHANQAAALGIRTVNLRTGLVIGADGGMLHTMLRPYRWGLGARLGSGRAWMPVISAHDWTRAVTFVLENEAITGPVNLVCPNPVRAKDFHELLARRVRRPAFLAVPETALRLLPSTYLKAFSQEVLLASQQAVPSVLLDAGFEFSAPHARKIIQQALPQR